MRGYVSDLNRQGDYPIIGRQGALCGNVNLAQGDFYATEHAVTVERYCDVDLMWTFYTLTSLNLNQYATATAQPGLSVNVINDVPIPVPPLHEQYRQLSSKLKAKSLTSLFMANSCHKTRAMSPHQNCSSASIRRLKSLVITSIVGSYPIIGVYVILEMFVCLRMALHSVATNIKQKEHH